MKALDLLGRLGKGRVPRPLLQGLKLAASTLPKLRGKSATAVVDHLTQKPPGKAARKKRDGADDVFDFTIHARPKPRFKRRHLRSRRANLPSR